jgi:ferredoxin-NADP reductase
VVEIVEETRDTKTFVLRPNAAWRGHRAGQYTSLEAEIDGVRVRRCYSISSGPSEALVSITVKRVADGRVSTWLHENVRAGHILGLGAPAGDFVLPSPTPDKLLLLSGGSGITPVMSMLLDLAVRDAIRDLVFVHHARRQAEVIFGEELADLAARRSGLRLVLCLDDDASSPRGFDEAYFAKLVPDFAESSTFLCGPKPLMDRAERLFESVGASCRSTSSTITAPGPTSQADNVSRNDRCHRALERGVVELGIDRSHHSAGAVTREAHLEWPRPRSLETP